MDAKEQIERINTLSAIARTSWLAMLGYFGFVGVTLLSVRDADFFLPGRETKLPLVDVAIPTFSFFVFAPILGAALYVYLHVHLLKLWDAIAAAPPRVKGEPLGERLHPWIANDFALARKRAGALRPRPLRWIGHFATWLLVWMLGPVVLAGFWWRSMPAHAELLTLALGGALLASVYAGWVSWRVSRDWLRDRAARPGPWVRWWRWPVAALLVVAVTMVGWARTEGGAEWWAGRVVDGVNLILWADERERDTHGYLRRCYPTDFGTEENDGPPRPDCLDDFGVEWPRDIVQEVRVRAVRWIPSDNHTLLRALRGILGKRVEETWRPLARTDLRGVEMVDVPEGWRMPGMARHAFRHFWCGREGLDMSVCDHPESVDRPMAPVVSRARLEWCAEEIKPEAECRKYFIELDARFEAAWTEERDVALANLPRLDLSGRDLRGAALDEATLIGADLNGARLEGAHLSEVRFEGADLSEARLEGAKLRGARLESADLSRAHLEWADLGDARLEGADLSEAHLEWAVLMGARLDGADLSRARLQGAVLMGASLDGAYLGGAQLDGAKLNGARLRGTHIDGARLDGADLRNSDFKEADLGSYSFRTSPAQAADFRNRQDLDQAQLEDLIGDADTLLPDRLNAHGKPYYVWSCWETPPVGLDELVMTWASINAESPETLRASFVCGPRNPRRKTGKPWPIDAPRPEGHPLGP